MDTLLLPTNLFEKFQVRYPLVGQERPFLLVFATLFIFEADGVYAGVILAFATTANLLKLFESNSTVDGAFNIKPGRERSTQAIP